MVLYIAPLETNAAQPPKYVCESVRVLTKALATMSDYLNFLQQREDSAPVKTILLVDDCPDGRQVVRTFLERDAGFKVCGEAGNGGEGIKQAEALTPDGALLDFLMPGMNGIDVAD